MKHSIIDILYMIGRLQFRLDLSEGGAGSNTVATKPHQMASCTCGGGGTEPNTAPEVKPA